MTLQTLAKRAAARHAALKGSNTAMAPQVEEPDNASQLSVHIPPGNPTAFLLQTAWLPQSSRSTRATRSRRGLAFGASGPDSHGSPAARGVAGRH